MADWTSAIIGGVVGAVLPAIGAAYFIGKQNSEIGTHMSHGAVPTVAELKQAFLDDTEFVAELRPDVVPGAGGSVPEGVVLASSVTCDALGDGWQPFREATGRFLVGAGTETLRAYRQWRPEGSPAGVNLSEYDVLAIGGEETHALTLEEMPSHNHGISASTGTDVHDGLAGFGDQIDYGIDQNFRADAPIAPFGRLENMVGPRGADDPHNNLPPYIALYFCKKG